MGWKNGKYYHRSKRIGDRVTSEYVGSGHSAWLMSQLDEQERQRAKTRRRAQQELEKREAAIDKRIDAIGDALQAMLAALMLASGYHTHKRQWRKVRNDR